MQPGTTLGGVVYTCRCSCGKRVTRRHEQLKSGTRSCGCLAQENKARTKRMYHGYAQAHMQHMEATRGRTYEPRLRHKMEEVG